MTKRNLIIIHRGPEYKRDFDEIAAKVNALDRNITIYHLADTLKVDLPISAWQFPTLTVSLSAKFGIPIRRGPILKNYAIGKLAQQEMFRRHNIPTPHALQFRFGMTLDPIVFGEFVILKTIDLARTSKGDAVHLYRRKRLEALHKVNSERSDWLRKHSGRMVVQKFVDTGTFPNHYRVQTFLGRIICSWNQALTLEQPPLDAPDEMIEKAVVASQAGDRRFRLNFEPDVLDLAERVHSQLPDVPMLGIDIVRDCKTGRLYVLECNAGGNTWHFSSRMGETLRCNLAQAEKENSLDASENGRVLLMKQFNAFDVVAAALADKTRECAA